MPTTDVEQSLVARCLMCDYSLRGLPENRCPECGRAFDPDDPRTMNMGREPGKLARLWLRPPGRLLNGLILANALLTLAAFSGPAPYFLLVLLCFAAWLGLGGLWMLRLVVGLIVAWRYRQPTFRQAITWRRYAVAPAILAVTVVLAIAQIPWHIGYLFSRPWMDSFAKEVMQSPGNPRQFALVGVYPVDRVEKLVHGMRFRVADSDFLDTAGFAYSPDGPPAVIGEDTYQPLGDGWYLWFESW
jgi:hypothetical protein